MKPILGYFKLRGWAGPIRLLLAYLEVDYVEKFYQLPEPDTNNNDKNYRNNQKGRITEDDWKLEKNTLGLPFPNLPYWIEDSIKLTETKAILRHIARTRNSLLLGQNTTENAKVNVLEDVLWDMWNALCQACLKNDNETVRNFFDLAKAKLALLSYNFTGMWAVGSNITVADFLLYEILYHYKRFSESLLQPFPTLTAFMRRFESIPQISKCMNSIQFIKGPCFSDKFKSKL